MGQQRDTRHERAAEYRRLAEEAEALASGTLFPDARESYRRYAQLWRAMADETEATIFKR